MDYIKLQELLHALIDKSICIIENAIDNEEIHKELAPFERWVVNDFSYGDRGVEIQQTSTYIQKPIWPHLTSFHLKLKIESTEEYRNVINLLNLLDSPDRKKLIEIERFIFRIIEFFLKNGSINEKQSIFFVNKYIAFLKDEALSSGVYAQLHGIILKSDKVVLNNNIVLRRPVKEDFEYEIPVFGLGPQPPFTQTPSSFLEIKIKATQRKEIQSLLDKIIDILRLFRPGCIKLIKCRIYSESFSSSFGGTITNYDFAFLEQYLLEKEEEQNLKNFIKLIFEVFQDSFFDFNNINNGYKNIGYNQYCDALLRNDQVERRISNTIMGLEALFFKSDGELQELQYRLKMRVAKLLSNFYQDPNDVSECIKDAYNIRSTFSHGARLSDSKRKSYESKYDGNLTNLLFRILDYLRVSLIVFLVITDKKDEFIDLIDKSLIDGKSWNILTEKIQDAGKLIEYSQKQN